MASDASLLARLGTRYKYLWQFARDPRTDGWFMINSQWPTFVICVSYILISKYIGPRLMKNRQPFQLKTPILVYNFAQIIISTYLFYLAGSGGWLSGYSWRCQAIDLTNSTQAATIATACYLYYLSKFLEFVDTAFFILRKRFHQVSNLHVFHHSTMAMGTWYCVKIYPGGHITFSGFFNTFVHIVMYTYYFLAALGPQYQKYLWWKKHLTKFQMIQFTLVFLHLLQLLFIDCPNVPKHLVFWSMMQAIFFFVMFFEFYVSAYYGRKERMKKDTLMKMLQCIPNQTEGKLKTNGHCNGNVIKQNGKSITNNGHFTTNNGNCATEIGNGGVTNNGNLASNNGNCASNNGNCAFNNRNCATHNGHLHLNDDPNGNIIGFVNLESNGTITRRMENGVRERSIANGAMQHSH